MDYQQILFIVSSTLLSIILIVAGVYVILILKELRETIKKANLVMSHVEKVTGAVSKPVIGLAGVITGISQGLKAYKGIKSLIGDSE